MIYQYEAKVLEHVNRAVPEIKLATYANNIDMFTSMSKVVKYPSLLYSRQETNWEFPAIHYTVDKVPEYYSPFEQEYIARIYVANQADALKIAGDLRFYWLRHSYVKVPVFDYLLTVALRLLYIKVSEERSGNDKIGPQRFVELSWKSRLFYTRRENEEAYQRSLVEEVHIFMEEDGIHVLNNNNLIMIVK